MAATNSTLPSALLNRRRRVRHKIQTPAYASFANDSKGAMLDLHEIVDISEDGMAIQCHSPIDVAQSVELCLDLDDCPQRIYTRGRVIWSNPSGRTGLRFSELPPDALSRLREWLFVNVMAGVANGEAEIAAFTGARDADPPRPGYSDILAALTAVQRQVQTAGPDLAGALKIITERAQALLRASGVAIALAHADPDFMICRASSGPDAPPVGARLQIGSGFSGECVRNAKLLRCNDSETDERVDRESCRALGIRSILAAPVRSTQKSVGLIEAFATLPNAFSESDEKVLRRLAETVLDSVNQAAHAEDLPILAPPPEEPFLPEGSVLFASADDEGKKVDSNGDDKSISGIFLPRSYLVILVCAAATIALVLGWGLAPWIQSQAFPWIQKKLRAREGVQLATVLASSQPPKSESSSGGPSVETATFDQLLQLAQKGDSVAQNALALRYATGEGVTLSEREAVRWFTKAAEAGYVPAQSKLGSIYYSGRGVPQDSNRAYFWMVVARLSGDDASAALAPFVQARLTRPQVTAIELDADRWLQQHQPNSKPAAGQLKAKFKVSGQ
jgi:GAF domain/PilZ domain/Sel1 repeat